MASVKEATILLLVMMFSINMGLIAINESDTGIPVFAGDSNTTGFDSIFTMDDLEADFLALKPVGKTDDDVPCVGGELGINCVLKGVTDFFSTAGQYTVFLVNSLFTFLNFIAKLINTLFFSWSDALNFLADKLEPEGQSIHLLFAVPRVLISAVIVLGIIQFIRDARS